MRLRISAVIAILSPAVAAAQWAPQASNTTSEIRGLVALSPTPSTLAQFTATCKELNSVATAWDKVRGAGLAEMNKALTAHGRAAITAPGALKLPRCV